MPHVDDYSDAGNHLGLPSPGKGRRQCLHGLSSFPPTSPASARNRFTPLAGGALTGDGTPVKYAAFIARRSSRISPIFAPDARVMEWHFTTASQQPKLTMKAELIGLDNDGPEIELVWDKLPVVIGRNPQADVRLDDRWVSRVHCEISQISGTLLVRDLGSRNGTLVNGRPVTEAHLLPGDRLTLGLTSFEVRYERCPRMLAAYASQSVE